MRIPQSTRTPSTVMQSESGRRIALLSLWAIAALALLLIPGSGCSMNTTDATGETKLENGNSLLKRLVSEQGDSGSDRSKPYSPKLRWDGGGAILGEVDHPLFSVPSFVERVDGLNREQRFRSLQHLVQRYPDVAASCLQEFDPQVHDSTTMALIAEQFQQQWSQPTAADGGWVQYVAQAPDFAATFDKKSRFREYLKQDEPEQALALDLLKNARPAGPALKSECLRLEAVAFMLQGNTRQAIERQRQAISELEKLSSYRANHALLLLGEFYRHHGDLDQWKATWELATSEQSQWVVSHDLLDPWFWDQAAFLRPADSDWPQQVTDNLRIYLRQSELPLRPEQAERLNDEMVIWLTIGLQHLTRGEGQNALLALKKAEATSTDPQIILELRLRQARALMLAAQPGAASAVLIKLITDHADQPLGDRAKAILGAMKLQNGAIGQGVNLLTAAHQSTENWPTGERLRVQADYALALLVRGRENEALPLLDKVHREFLEQGEVLQAQQCLWNKAIYFENTEQKQQHKQTLQDLADFEKL